jgi:hypothetical protein
MLNIDTFWLQMDLISYILCIHVFYHIIWTIFIKVTFSKSIIFKVKNMFESNVFKLVIKIIFINSNPFTFLIINVKILSNVQKELCTFNREEKNFEFFFGSHLRFECFKHVKTFLICVKFWTCRICNWLKII